MESMKKILPWVATSIMLFNNLAFVKELTTQNPNVSQIASIGMGKANITNLSNDQKSVVIGTYKDGKFEEGELVDILKFPNKNIQISKKWNIDNGKYEYKLESETKPEIAFALKNRSESSQKVEFKLELDSNFELKGGAGTDDTTPFVEFMDLKEESFSPNNKKEPNGYSTELELSGKGEVKQFRIVIDLDKLSLSSLEKIFTKVDPNSDLDATVDLFKLTLTLKENSSSGS